MIVCEPDGHILLIDDRDASRINVLAPDFDRTQLQAEAEAWGATEPPPIPQEISMMQARLVLNETPSSSGVAGRTMLDDVADGVNASSKAVQIYWEYTSILHRDHPVVAQLTAALGMSSAEVDQLFLAASQLT